MPRIESLQQVEGLARRMMRRSTGAGTAKEKGGATFRRRAAFNPSSPAPWRDGGIAATIASDRARAPQARV